MSLVPSTRDERPQITPYKPGAGRNRIPGDQHGANNGFDLNDFMHAIRQHKLMILIILILFTIASGVGTYVWKIAAPRYTAESYIEVRTPRGTMDVGPGMAAGTKDQIERLARTKQQMIKTSTVLSRACENDDVTNTKWWTKHRKDAIRELTDKVNVGVLNGTNLIRISLSGENKKEITQIVNAITEAAVAVDKTITNANYQADITQLNDGLNKMTAELTSIQKALVRELDDNMRPTALSAKAALVSKVTQLSKEHSTLVAALGEANAALQDLKKPDEELAQMPEVQMQLQYDPSVQGAENQMKSMYVELQAVREKYGPNHVIRKSVENRYNTLEEEYNKKKQEAIARFVSTLKSSRQIEFDKAATAESKIREAWDAADKELKRVEKHIQDVEKMRDDEKILTADIKKKREKVSELTMLQKNEEVLQIAKPASIPLDISWPLFKVMIPAGVMLGLIVSVGLAVLLELLDKTVKSPSDVSRKIDLPLLGIVPHTDDLYEEISDIRRVFVDSPNTIIDESFRQIRTNLMFSGFSETRKSLLITSPQPEDGRTTVALNLGAMMAQSGKKVLVIDANFRQPSFNKLFAHLNPVGLSEIVDEKLDWRESVLQIESNLSVLGSGKSPINPTELLGSENIRALIDDLYSEYDQIIFDGAPCMVVSDSIVLSTVVDGVICSVRAGINSSGIVVRMRNMLERVGAHIYGVVLNGVRVTAGGYLRKNYETFYEYRETVALEGKASDNQTADPAAQLPARKVKVTRQETASDDTQGKKSPGIIDHEPDSEK